MIEEPYRWVEAIANRREYIEHQIAGGSPIAGLSYRGGILLFTLGRERQKLFEIYDRIGLGTIGHPGDIERLRMTAIEITSTEGFARSAHDVSLRRLANYSLSPALKAAFEQIYGAPYLVRMLFTELGRDDAPNTFLRLDYDGSIHTNGGTSGRAGEEFGVIAGTAASAAKMEGFLREQTLPAATLEKALAIALEAWTLGHLTQASEPTEDLPSEEALARHRKEQLGAASIEVAILTDSGSQAATWRSFPDAEIRPHFEKR